MTGRWPRALALLLVSLPAPTHPPAPRPLKPPGPGDRLLVVAPHPDDETLCCAGLLQQAERAGAAVAVVWITAGDSFEIDAIVTERTLRPRGAGFESLGRQRIAEAHAAADRLGIPRTQQYLLGFPDRDLGALLHRPESLPLRSPHTGVDAVPYADALHPGSAYTGASLRGSLREVIDTFGPTIMLVAAPQDRHPDHSASGALALELARARSHSISVYYWIVHAGLKWPAPRGLHPTQPLRPPAHTAALAWQTLPLDAAQVAGKLSALREHRTQLKVMPRFLYSFVRTNEIFAPAPGETLSR